MGSTNGLLGQEMRFVVWMGQRESAGLWVWVGGIINPKSSFSVGVTAKKEPAVCLRVSICLSLKPCV